MDKFETFERELGLEIHERFTKMAAHLEQRVSRIDSKPENLGRN
jgi:hypothetical protein